MDDMAFLAVDNSIIDIKKILENARKITLEWGLRNVVTYDPDKTKVMPFSKVGKQKLIQ